MTRIGEIVEITEILSSRWLPPRDGRTHCRQTFPHLPRLAKDRKSRETNPSNLDAENSIDSYDCVVKRLTSVSRADGFEPPVGHDCGAVGRWMNAIGRPPRRRSDLRRRVEHRLKWHEHSAGFVRHTLRGGAIGVDRREPFGVHVARF